MSSSSRDYVFDSAQVEAFIHRANQLREAGAKEEPLKANLFSYLPRIFTDQPAWLSHHVEGTETRLQVVLDGATVGRFADSLVGLTTVEYEPDLRRRDRYFGGLHQVQEHCAGLLNDAHEADKIIGVLSDSVLWYAFSVKPIAERIPGQYSADDLELVLINKIDVSGQNPTAVSELVDFLVRYLGRQGSRPLTAQTIASDLGVDSLFGTEHVQAVRNLVDDAFAERPEYSGLIEGLWLRFVAVAGSGGSGVEFDMANYSDELYLVTLSKLVCANVLERQALRSSDAVLKCILDGSYFRSLGLANLVEYDYFGWLAESPYVEKLLPAAGLIQEDLCAYDFENLPPQDLFGCLMAQLGRRSHRLLLGQEFTPSWLCDAMAKKTLNSLPEDESPRLVDMCCGSGGMVVAVCRRYSERLKESGLQLGEPAGLARLTDAITGFDIDPLAVLLAKVNWAVTNRDWLTEGSRVSIPVYHADSLFVHVPFAEAKTPGDEYLLALHNGATLTLPEFLIQPSSRTLFDDLLSRAYSMSKAALTRDLDQGALSAAVNYGIQESSIDLGTEQTQAVLAFFTELVRVLADLQRAGLNGVWAFILKNSYRPSLVAGQFNGIISNPPWLALSKIANNPYGELLRDLAARLDLSPPGASHLHTELATIFTVASVDRYLADDGFVACILPDTVMNGHQHEPFRVTTSGRSVSPVKLNVGELWRVSRGTFKNEAVVFYGRKSEGATSEVIPGLEVSSGSVSKTEFRIVSRGDRHIWTDLDMESQESQFFDAGDFRQGADLMPRTLVFHDLTPVSSSRWTVRAIDRQNSPLRYLVTAAKESRDFAIQAGTVRDEYVFQALLSNHLSPFVLSDPVPALLPFRRTDEAWEPISAQELAADPPTGDVFGSVLTELGEGATVASRDVV